MEANRPEKVAGVLLAKIGKLPRKGACFALMAANAPHLVFEDLSRRSACPIDQAVAIKALRRVSVPRRGASDDSFDPARWITQYLMSESRDC